MPAYLIGLPGRQNFLRLLGHDLERILLPAIGSYFPEPRDSGTPVQANFRRVLVSTAVPPRWRAIVWGRSGRQARPKVGRPCQRTGPYERTAEFLYVDDHDVRLIAKLSLELDGAFEVRACANGHEVLKLITRGDWRPDVFILDVMMTDISGPALLAQIRTVPGHRDTNLIFLTAGIFAADVARFRALGVAGGIAKPFDPLTLGSRVRALLADDSAWTIILTKIAASNSIACGGLPCGSWVWRWARPHDRASTTVARAVRRAGEDEHTPSP